MKRLNVFVFGKSGSMPSSAHHMLKVSPAMGPCTSRMGTLAVLHTHHTSDPQTTATV